MKNPNDAGLVYLGLKKIQDGVQNGRRCQHFDVCGDIIVFLSIILILCSLSQNDFMMVNNLEVK